MRFLVASLSAFAVLLLGSCAAPRGEGGDARQVATGGYEAAPGTLPPRYASREFPRGRMPVADFVLVDKSERLLIAYSNGKPIRAYRSLRFGDEPSGHKRFEGDERTPEGRYTIDWRNPQSAYHLSLRISYPNARDRAFAAQYGRSAGGDIFIHGQPTGYSGPPIGRDWTDGCIALTNEEIEELWQIVPDGTPIEIRP
ncbi:MAG: L,D-transpeptidase family protein [Erythrobacter sp.]